MPEFLWELLYMYMQLHASQHGVSAYQTAGLRGGDLSAGPLRNVGLGKPIS